MEEDLVALLLGTAGITTLIGDRLTWDRRQQGASLPALVLTTVSRVPDYTMASASGLERSRIQVDCWATTRASANALGAALRTALSGFNGDLDTVHLTAFVEDEADSFELSTAGEELYRKRIDLMIWHRELAT